MRVHPRFNGISHKMFKADESEFKLSRRTIEKIEALPRRKQAYIAGRLQGKSKYAAAIDAGYSKSTAASVKALIETVDVEDALESVLRDVIPIKHLAQRLAEGLDAVEIETIQLTPKGDKHPRFKHFTRVNWAERRQYVVLISKILGVECFRRTLHKNREPNVIVEFDNVVCSPSIGLESQGDPVSNPSAGTELSRDLFTLRGEETTRHQV